MKKLMLASAIAMMCFSANAFAEDDGYGNDIPSNNIEYKSFEEARASSSGGSYLPAFNVGVHFGIGAGMYWDYPTNEYMLEYYGKNDWVSISFDIGGVAKYRVSNFLSIVPELNLGINVTSREIGRGSTWFYGDYKVEETRTLINLNVPLTLRLTPVPFAYVEAGARFNMNLGTSHTRDYYDSDGERLKTWGGDDIQDELEEWKVKMFVPSFVAGFGGTIRVAGGHEMDLGVRLILDLVGIEKDDQVNFKVDGEDVKIAGRNVVVENKTKMWAIQFAMNYYFL